MAQTQHPAMARAVVAQLEVEGPAVQRIDEPVGGPSLADGIAEVKSRRLLEEGAIEVRVSGGAGRPWYASGGHSSLLVRG